MTFSACWYPTQHLDSWKLDGAEIIIEKPLIPVYEKMVDVIDNGLSSIQGIGGMIKLNTLRIGQNHITDIEPVAELNDLTDLSFGHNEVEDISALYALPMLHVLTFNYNKVRDIGPVAEMKELTWLEVKGNPIEDTSILDNLPASVKHLERAPVFFPTDMERYEQWFKNGDLRVFAAEADGEIIGFISLEDEAENFITRHNTMKNICGAYAMEYEKDSTNAELIDNIREMIST